MVEAVLSDLKKKIEDWAQGRSVVFIFATTTGLWLQPYLGLMEKCKIIAVVAHKLGNPRWKPFDPVMRQRIESLGGIVIEEKAFWAVLRITSMLMSKYVVPLFSFKAKNWEELLGVGGRVCLQITEIAIKENLVKENAIVVAMSGKNAALVAQVTCTKPVKMALLDIIVRPEVKFDRSNYEHQG